MISRRILAAVALVCAAAMPAHAQKTKAQLNTEVGTALPDNNTGAITPLGLRNLSNDIINSIMPTAPVVSGNSVCFNGTTGLLQDCGSAPGNPFNGQFIGVSVNSYGAINDGTTNSTRYLVTAATYANANRLGLIFSSGSNYRHTPIQYGGSNPTSGTATAAIAGTTMTVMTTPTVQIVPGQSVSCGSCTADTVITGYLGRTAGFIGTYTVNNAQNVGASFTGVGVGTNLTVSAITGTIGGGHILYATGIPAGTTIVSQTSGPAGGAGVYVTSAATTANGAVVSSSTAVTLTAPSVTGSIIGDTLTATVNSGRLTTVDSLVGGTIIPGTTIVSQLTGSAGLSGTYRVSYPQTVGAGTSIRAYPYTVVPIPNFLVGAIGGETQTVLAPLPGTVSPHALVKIVDPPALGAVLGFQIANFRISAGGQYANAVMMHGFSATSGGGIPVARNLTLSGGTGATCNMNLIGNAPAGPSWGIIEASFSDISAAGATVCDYNLDGNNGDTSHNIQSVVMTGIKANSFSSGNGFNLDYAEITCIECLSQNHTGVPISFDHTSHPQFINFYSEGDAAGAVTSTANTFGVKMTGTAVGGVDSGLLTGCTHDIDIHIAAGVGTYPTNTQRNFGCATGQTVSVGGALTILPAASTGLLASSGNSGLYLSGSGTTYDVSLGNKNGDLPTCGVLTGTRQLSCNAFDIGGKAITLGGGFTMSGAFGFTGTLTGTTAVTFPTSGTLATVGTDTTYAFRANNLSDLASASTARTNLGLGSSATVNTGTSGGTIPLLNGANTWSATQGFAAITATTFNGNALTTGTGTLTLGAGKTATISNTLTFTGTDGSSVAFGTGGTVLYSGGAAGGDLGGTYPNPTINNAPVIAKVLTGFTSGAGTVSATDSILSALQKIDGNVALKAPLSSPALTGTPTAPTAAVDTNTTQIATTAMVLAQAASATPLVNGTAAVGTSTRYARADHVHPIDTRSGDMGVSVTGVNFNSANTDTALAVVLPTGYTRFAVHRLLISNASASLTTSTFGLFTTTGGGGAGIVASGTANLVSTSADNTASNTMAANPSIAIAMKASTLATPSTVYLRVQTPQGSAATADVTLYYQPLP